MLTLYCPVTADWSHRKIAAHFTRYADLAATSWQTTLSDILFCFTPPGTLDKIYVDEAVSELHTLQGYAALEQ